ncbi:hypothetical protein DVH05_020675 [Phytophthora capsici]|nr:hypothetical protein DVH05_020675 [Phytophthora capsici]
MQSSQLLVVFSLLVAVSALQPTDARQLGSYNGYGHHHYKHDNDHKKRHHRHDHNDSHYRRRLEDKDNSEQSSDYV